MFSEDDEIVDESEARRKISDIFIEEGLDPEEHQDLIEEVLKMLEVSADE